MAFIAKITEHLNAQKDDVEGHKLFPRADWRYEVENGDTSLGYEDWLEDKIGFEAQDVLDAVMTLIDEANAASWLSISEIQFAQTVLDSFSTMRIYDDAPVFRAAGFLRKELETPVFGEVFGAVPPEIAQLVSQLADAGMGWYEGNVSRDDLLSCREQLVLCGAASVDDPPEP